MKKLIFLTLFLLVSVLGNSQCIGGICSHEEGEEPYITPGFIGEYSMRFYGFTNFAGMNINAGVWIDHIGLFGGYRIYKLDEKTPDSRNAYISIMARYRLINDKILMSPFFSVGFNNYQDIGIRVGYEIYKGQSIGIVISRTMHYGISTVWSIFK